MNVTRLSALVFATLGATVIASPALAQLEEIVVTATRRAESLQDVPISVTAVTGETILEYGFSDMEDMSQFVPNLWMRDSFTGQSLVIRGIGTSTGNEAFEQAVAQFHDGVYYGRDNLSQNAFFDLERVEVVRGPQPTFAGQSATAGALNYISRRPGDAFEGNITAAYGSDEESNIEFGFGGPITDTFGIRIAGRDYALDDAYYTDVTTGKPLGIKENTAFRVTGVWEPTDRFNMTIKYEHNDVWQIGTPREYTRCDTRAEFSSAHPAVTGPRPNPFPAMCALDILYNGTTLDVLDGLSATGGTQDIWEVTRALDAQFGYTPGAKSTGGISFSPVDCADNDIPGCSNLAHGLNNVAEYGFEEEREHDSDVFLLDMNWDVGDYTLSLTTSTVEYDKHDWLDPDAGTVAIFTDERIETFEQDGVEFRITSPADRRFSWMAGAYYQTSDLATTIDVFLPQVLGPNPNDAIAVSFGGDLTEEATWTSVFFMGTLSLTDSFRLNFGGRQQDIQKDGILAPTRAFLYEGMTTYYPNGRVREPNGPPVPGNADADDTLPEVGFEWDVGGGMFYAKYAEALKAGGFVMSPAIGGMLPNPLTYRPEFAEGVEVGFKTLMANDTLELNLAYYDVDFTDLQVTIFLSEQGRFVTDNAAQAHTTGIEFDGRWAAGDNFTLGFGGAFNEAEYDKYDGADCNSLDVKLAGGPCFNDLAGVSLPLSPDWTLTLSPEYRFRIGNFDARFGAILAYTDQFDLGNDFDPIDVVPSSHRLDLRLGFSPPSGDWEIAIYGRDVTDEQNIIGGVGDFQNKSLDLIYDAGGVTQERGARWGIQGSYFFGN